MFIGLNPSTADETTDDPTIRRCIGFARAWGFSALCMTNLFAWRATDPRDLPTDAAAIGPENDGYLTRASDGAGLTVAAWGTHGARLGRDAQVMAMLPGLHCLGRTKAGHPRHPLYLRRSCRPEPFSGRVDALQAVVVGPAEASR